MGCFQNDHPLSCSIKSSEFLDHLNDFQFLKMDPAPWSSFELKKCLLLFCYGYFIFPSPVKAAVEALGGRGGIAPTHSRPRH
jgi:hypothetical protein